MPKRSRSKKARRYGDCTPQPPCTSGDNTGRVFGTVACGFDEYGYPMVRTCRLPAPFKVAQGRRYGAAQSMIKPMKLVAANGQPPQPKPGVAAVDKFKLKPSPTVPGAPDDLPSKYKFCVQKGEHGFFYRFRNSKTSLHGSEAEVLGCEPDESGLMICMVQMPSASGPVEAPLCEDETADKEPLSEDCCVRVLGEDTAQLVCPGSSYDLLIVQIVTFADIGGIQIASVSHPDLPGGGARLPICEPIDEEPDERPCCIEEKTGMIICPEGSDFPLNGQKIPMEFLEFAENVDGMRVARLRCGDIANVPEGERAGNPALEAMHNICQELGGYVFRVCTKSPPKILNPVPAPPKFPDICCYDASSGTLVCEGTVYDGLSVEVVAEAVVAGKAFVSVASNALPGGGIRIPLCPSPPDIPRVPPAECCVVETSSTLTLVCDPKDHPWNGKDVTSLGKCIETPNGRMCVLRWEDKFGKNTLEVPLCPPPPGIDIPPPPEGDTPPPDGDTPPPPGGDGPPPEVYIPPPTRPPADGCDSDEAASCRQNWDEMMARPVELTKCDKKWIAMMERLKAGQGRGGPGRRASSLIGSKMRRIAR